LRTTAPPMRREVTNPARDGPQSCTDATFNIRSLPRLVVPSRLTRSYSDRCVRRRFFRNENEPRGAICTVNPPTIDRLIPRRLRQASLREIRGRVQKKSSSENSVEDFPKNQIGQLMSPVIGRASQLEIPWLQQELRIQRDSSRQSSQAQWSELALSRA
jgi:hypothetical protein